MRKNIVCTHDTFYPALDILLTNTLYYPYPPPGGMGTITDEDKGDQHGFR